MKETMSSMLKLKEQLLWVEVVVMFRAGLDS
jgi:hypothetical protein